MIHGTATMAKARIGANCLRDEELRFGHGIGNTESQGKAGGDGGGISAARAMGVDGFDAGSVVFVELVVVEEDIAGHAIQVATFD